MHSQTTLSIFVHIQDYTRHQHRATLHTGSQHQHTSHLSSGTDTEQLNRSATSKMEANSRTQLIKQRSECLTIEVTHMWVATLVTIGRYSLTNLENLQNTTKQHMINSPSSNTNYKLLQCTPQPTK
jgi:hypothetical protein